MPLPGHRRSSARSSCRPPADARWRSCVTTATPTLVGVAAALGPRRRRRRSRATEPPPRRPTSPRSTSCTSPALHLEQYRHATRRPSRTGRRRCAATPATSAATSRSARGCTRGRYDEAQPHLRRAVAGPSPVNPNPADGEAHYRLGLTLATRAATPRLAAAGKAAWNAAWQSPAHWALARLAAGRPATCARRVAHARAGCGLDPQHLQATALVILLLRRLTAPPRRRVLARRRSPRPARPVGPRSRRAAVTDDAPDPARRRARLRGRRLRRRCAAVLDLAPRGTAGCARTGSLRWCTTTARRCRTDCRPTARGGPPRAPVDADRHCLASRLADVDALLAALAAESGPTRLRSCCWAAGSTTGGAPDAIAALAAAPPAATPAEPVRADRNLGLAAYNVAATTAAARGRLPRAAPG